MIDKKRLVWGQISKFRDFKDFSCYVFTANCKEVRASLKLRETCLTIFGSIISTYKLALIDFASHKTKTIS